jgi:DNA-binding transcriptional LysR family regulator
MSSLSDWSLARSFLAVWREGSLSAAARATGLTQPTIARHIDLLEQALGASLFTRSPSGLLPTDTARTVVTHAEAAESAIAAMERAASREGKDTLAGTVRITASEIVGTAILPPVLAALRSKEPNIVIELALSNRTDDLLRREADIAVRMVRPKQEGLVARKIGEAPLGFYAHRSYAERFGLPKTVPDLTTFHIIGFDRNAHSAKAVAKGIMPIDRTLFAFRCDSDVAQMAALKAGLGIGVIQHAIAAQDANLVPVLKDQIVFRLELWLAVHEDLRHQPAVRAVFDWLTHALARHAAPA